MKTWSKPTTETTSTPSGATNLNDLSDVVISSPQINQVLSYNGSQFINGAVPGLSEVQAQFNNLNASNITSGTLAYARLPDLNFAPGAMMAPFITSISPPGILNNKTQDIEIIGNYFTPISSLEIPNTSVNSLQITPQKIIANITTSNIIGASTIDVVVKNGQASSTAWPTSIKSLPLGSDPFFLQVSLFLEGDGSNNSTSIVDSSPTPKNINRYGETKITTAKSKYGGSSIIFNGSTDYIGTPAVGDLNFTNQSFTWECWVLFDILPGTTPMSIISTARSVSGNYGHFLCCTNSEFRLRDWLTNNGSFFSLTIQTNTWYHIACQKNGSTSKIWINGVKGTDGSITATNVSTSELLIGFTNNNGGFSSLFRGYIDSLRITTTERYTSNFNPETDTYLDT